MYWNLESLEEFWILVYRYVILRRRTDMGTFLSLLSCRYIITHGSCLWEVEKKIENPSTPTATKYCSTMADRFPTCGESRHCAFWGRSPPLFYLPRLMMLRKRFTITGWMTGCIFSEFINTKCILFVWDFKWDAYDSILYYTTVNSYQLLLQFLLKKNKYY